MARILPERTVDAWTASYITGRRWRARLWAPTEQRPGERYDLAAGLGDVGAVPVPPHRERWPDKVFVLEHKGVDEVGPGSVPVIWLSIRQLLTHLAEDRARGGKLVYYLLPDPEWRGRRSARYGRLPSVAWRRTRGPTLPSGHGPAWEGFQIWAFVAHVEDLARHLAAVCGLTPGRFKGPSKASSPDWVYPLTLPELARIGDATSLRDFVSGVRECTHGRPASEVASHPPLAGGGWLPDLLGPSRRELVAALQAAAEPGLSEGAEDFATPVLDEQDELAVADSELLDAFARPGFVTLYGVGDSDQSVG